MPIAVVFGRLAWSPGVFLHLVSVAGQSMFYMETPVGYGDMLAIEAIAARFSVLHLHCDWFQQMTDRNFQQLVKEYMFDPTDLFRKKAERIKEKKKDGRK